MSLQSIAATIAVLGFALPLPAFADDNYLNIIQDGDTHVGLVIQTGLGNAAGTPDLPVHQQGVFNDLSLTQSGDNNDIGLFGRGFAQSGTASADGDAANRATVIQNSNGNSIGELVQTTLGTHPTTGNTLSVTQDLKGANTIVSIEQVQDDAESANFATIAQTGFQNWLRWVYQHTSSGEGANHVTLNVTGDYNGIDSGSLAGAGPLAILARSAGASASTIIQDADLSGGAGNTIELAITGDYNQFGLTQLGTDNSVGESITGSDNSFAAYQVGDHNQIVSGGIAGDSNDLGISQTGYSNTVSAVLNWSSSDNQVGIGQFGDANTGNVSLKGDHALVGLSQNGNGHSAEITTVGDGNVVLTIQANAGYTASFGNALTIDINGNGINGPAGSAAFTGLALAAAQLAPAIPRSLLISPDATLLMSSLQGEITLVPGLLAQWGDGNSMEITVGSNVASDDNLFAAIQRGSGNQLVASINGYGNQFIVSQVGDANAAAIQQSGNGNTAVISQ